MRAFKDNLTESKCIVVSDFKDIYLGKFVIKFWGWKSSKIRLKSKKKNIILMPMTMHVNLISSIINTMNNYHIKTHIQTGAFRWSLLTMKCVVDILTYWIDRPSHTKRSYLKECRHVSITKIVFASSHNLMSLSVILVF